MTFGDIAIGIGLVVGAGATVYGANKQGKIANTQLGLEQQQLVLQQDIANKQDTSFAQLQQLISDPNSFFSSDVYKAAASQGADAVTRATSASAGGGPSGAQLTALQGFGQSFGAQQLLSQEQLLAGMSGTGFNPAGGGPNPAGAAGLQTQNLESLAGLFSFFGSSGIGGKGSTGSAGDGYWSLPGGGSFDGSAGTYTDVLN